MKIRITLRVEGKESAAGTITLDDRKLEGLTEEEVERSVEILVSQWANERIEIGWEAETDGEEQEASK